MRHMHASTCTCIQQLVPQHSNTVTHTCEARCCCGCMHAFESRLNAAALCQHETCMPNTHAHAYTCGTHHAACNMPLRTTVSGDDAHRCDMRRRDHTHHMWMLLLPFYTMREGMRCVLVNWCACGVWRDSCMRVCAVAAWCCCCCGCVHVAAWMCVCFHGAAAVCVRVCKRLYCAVCVLGVLVLGASMRLSLCLICAVVCCV